MRIVPDDSVASSLADPVCFTGRVWRTDYLRPTAPDRLAGVRFLYEPGARSFWHVHECDQAIVAVYGQGLVAWQGIDAPVTLRQGDWWHVEPGVPHWHGATLDASFAHLAVTVGGATTWLHEVSETDYRANRTAQPGAPPARHPDEPAGWYRPVE